MIKHMERLKRVELTKPGMWALEKIRFARGRSLNLSDLKIIDGMCKWCNITPIKSKRAHYCGNNCKTSAHLYCYPQSPNAKAWRLIELQGFKCGECSVNYFDWVIERIGKFYIQNIKRLKRLEDLKIPLDDHDRDLRVNYYQIGSNCGDVLQVDHKIPIFQGGHGVISENIQVICTDCHKAKTARERSGEHPSRGLEVFS